MNTQTNPGDVRGTVPAAQEPNDWNLQAGTGQLRKVLAGRCNRAGWRRRAKEGMTD